MKIVDGVPELMPLKKDELADEAEEDEGPDDDEGDEGDEY